MGRRLEPRRRWGPLGWLAALLGASVLTSGFPPTQAQPGIINITITWEPAEPFVGGEVTLTPGGKPDFGSCLWSRLRDGKQSFIFAYFPPPKDELHKGPEYSNRETAGPKCSLHIKNLTLEDSGTYTVSKDGTDFDTEGGEAHIKVHAQRVVNTNVNTNTNTNQGVIAGIAVGAAVGALLIGVLF